MPKITVCKGCGQAMMAVFGKGEGEGQPACITCYGLSPDNSVPIEMEISDKIECSYCCGSVAEWDKEKQKWRWGNRLVGVNELPFMDAKKGIFYCGCRGWD